MASGNNIGPKIGIDGEAEFRKEIASINSSLKTMGAEMEAVTASFIGNERSVEALTAKNDVLQKRMDELTKKADAQRAQLEKLDAAGVDPTSAAYQKLQADLYKTEAAMGKTDAEIKANSELIRNNGKTAQEMAREQEEAAKKAEAAHARHKKAVEDVAKVMAGAVAAVAAFGAAVAKMTLDAAAAADDLVTLSVQTGISTDELQKLQYASEAIDVDVSTLTGSMSKLTKNMASAASGTGATAEAFAALGVEVTDSNGELRDRNEVFQEAIKALGEMSNETERDAVAMKIFGKSAQELNPLIEGGADALAELGAHAEEAGLIMSGDTLASLAGLNDAFGIFKSTLSMAGQSMLAEFAGPMTEAMQTVTSYVEQLLAAFREGGFGSLGETVGAIASDVSEKLTALLPGLASFASQAIMTIAKGLIAQLPAIVKSAIQIITSLVSALADALPELIPVAVDAVLTLVDTLTDPDTLGDMIDAAIAIVIALANGLIDALPKLLEKAPEIIANLVTAIVENVPKLVEAAFEIVGKLVSGIIENLPELGKAALEIINTLLSGLAQLWDKMLGIGRNIVEGIWQGISDMASWLWEKVSGFFGGIVDGVMGFLGIHSPSTVFAGIGENMAAGIGVGFGKTMDKVERDMMSSLSVPAVNVGVGATPITGAAGGSIVEEITIPVEVGGVELARVLYRHIVGEGERIGAAAVG